MRRERWIPPRPENDDTGGRGGERPLLEQSPLYVIMLAGVPARSAKTTASASTTSFLRRGKKAPIALAQGGLQEGGATLTMIFGFPRTDPIRLDDKDVEFVTTIGTIEIKKKFTLRDLVFNGQLEL
jgi:hypothetical protein